MKLVLLDPEKGYEDKKKISWIDANLQDLIEYHRGFEDFNSQSLDRYYLYTGRGPSQGTLHIGHLLGLKLIKGLSSQFESKIFFMIASPKDNPNEYLKLLGKISEIFLDEQNRNLVLEVKNENDLLELLDKYEI